MKAILLATGEAARLRPVTDHLPSPLLPIANRPVIVYAIETLVRAGLKDITVAVHHLAGSIEAYCGDGRRWGAALTYAVLPQPFGSAGALKWAAAYAAAEETCVVLPADELLDVDLSKALDAHRSSGAAVTVMARAQRDQPRNPIGVDAARQITVATRDGDWSNATVLDNIGAYILEPAALKFIPDRTRCDLAADLLPALIAQQTNVMAHTIDGYWNTLDTPADLHTAQLVVLHSARRNPPVTSKLPKIAHPYIEGKQIADGIWIGRNTAIHPSAKIAAPIVIGDNGQIGREVELGPNVILGANVVIDDEATLTNSTITDHTYVGRLVKITDRVVHRTQLIDFSGENTPVVDRFLLSETGLSLTGQATWRVVDVIVASLTLVGVSPLLLLIGLWSILRTGRLFVRTPLIKSRQGEPVAFDSLRFNVLKNAELDQLPQLINVLRGDLSLVGVKPLSPAEADRVTDDWQKQRYTCPAGCTGEWYVQTQPASTLDEVLVADAYYAATRSARGDLRLLLRTPRAWWRRRQSSPKG
ncbi:MAG: sugar transferase [Thermoflexales bacterium]|nr:sugar transferase [Thermoflexales bacterium]